MTQKQTVSEWIVTPAIRDPIILPPEIRHAARSVSFIRALLLADRLTTRDDYWALVDLMRPEIQSIMGDAEVVVFAPGWIPKLAARGAERLLPVEAQHILDNRYGPEGLGGFQDGLRQANDFRDRWLFRSKQALAVLWALVTVEAAGANPLALERQLAGSETWQLAYGTNTDRPSRREHKELMARLKQQDWKELNDRELLATARAYVELHHVYDSRLTEWLENRDGECPLSDDVSKWSTRFKPLDEALGRPRVRGGHRERRPGV